MNKYFLYEDVDLMPSGWYVKFEDIPQWVSVKDRLPEKHQPVLLRSILHGQNIEGRVVHYEGYLCNDGKTFSDWCGDIDDGEISHWMPLPPKPEVA